ncbi:MAG: hypothetical protein HKN45_05385 [Flavobacteriales bacterium]|nr:hypothetical protein [Flavobacteriales bacterium]
MIKFFRKIRQRLLSENRLGRYLIYAIGEIILVVIGILIALQLNIEKEKINDRKVEIVHLNNLHQDLTQEVIDLEKIVKFKTDQSRFARMVIEYIDGERTQDLDSLNMAQWASFIWHTHSPNNNSFVELKSSGKLSTIQDNNIRQLLLDIDSRYTGLHGIEEHMKFEYHEFLYQKNINTIDYELMFGAFKKKGKELSRNDSLLLIQNRAEIRGDKRLKNAYFLAFTNNKRHASRCEGILEKVHETIALIEQDLNKE